MIGANIVHAGQYPDEAQCRPYDLVSAGGLKIVKVVVVRNYVS
jgi:hypothetical protein